MRGSLYNLTSFTASSVAVVEGNSDEDEAILLVLYVSDPAVMKLWLKKGEKSHEKSREKKSQKKKNNAAIKSREK